MQDKLAIIAGKGEIPKMIIKKCQEQKREFVVFLIAGEKSNEEYLQFPHEIVHFGTVSHTLKTLKKHQIKELVFVGGVSKPSMTGMKVDAKGTILISKILKNKFFGDDNLLSTIINFFEKEGFKVIAANEIIADLVAKKGILTAKKPNKEQLKDIEIGKNALNIMADLDIGQAIAVQQKQIIGVEAIEGTDALIKRCKDVQFKNGSKPVLIKKKKQNQNTKIDLPAVGKDTIKNLRDCGFSGIAFEAGSCLIINQEEVVKLANDYDLFIVGI